MNKKGQVLQGLGALGIGIASLVIVLVVAFLVIANTQTQIVSVQGITNTSQATLAYNSTQTLQEGAATIPGWVPLIILVSIGSIILMMVKGFRK